MAQPTVVASHALLSSATHGFSSLINSELAAGACRKNVVCAASPSSTTTRSADPDGAQQGTIKAVLFDMDGVLVNSEELSRRAGCQVLKDLYGIDQAKPEEFAAFSGMGEDRFLGGVAELYGAKDFDAATARRAFLECYSKAAAELTASGNSSSGASGSSGLSLAYPGAVQLVRACRASGLKVAVASSADAVKVEASLKAAGFDPAVDFDALMAANDIGAAGGALKPLPDVFLLAAQRLGVAPGSCVVVEDSRAGLQAAQAAGMAAVGVATTMTLEGLQQHLRHQQQQQGSGRSNTSAPTLAVPSLASITPEMLMSLSVTQQPAGTATAAGVSTGATAQPQQPQNQQQQVQQGPQQQQQGPQQQQQGQAGWLEGRVDLPGGMRTTRRELLKFIPLLGGIGCFYVAGTRLKAMSFVSPQAIINEMVPQGPDTSAMPAEMNERVAAFREYILDLEARGGGRQVPDFTPGLDWLNSGPLSLNRTPLKGKVVLLDFWTYCCINCMHVLPELAALEARYAGAPVAVVGVHSAKFDNERDSEAIQAAVLRYDISHPVVNDAAMSLWGALGVSSWPTVAVVSPRGRLLAMLSGEGHGQDLQDFVAAALDVYGARGELDNTPLQAVLERDKQQGLGASPLRYPGKIAVDPRGSGRLFISDSNNHRIVITDLSGAFLDQIGGNGPALVDGGFEVAGLNRPQGLAYCSATDTLYIADTENHALRAADIKARRIVTLAGNGSKGGDYRGGGRGNSQVLNSPWDVALDDPSAPSRVIVAMAGQHQVWALDLASGTVACISGNGYERNQNGTSRLSTSWAQPSGLALDKHGSGAGAGRGSGAVRMWVADSESSSVRLLDVSTGGSSAAAGGDPLFADNLFRFGDRDGIGSDALLQHPLAVCMPGDGSKGVFIADSYNHRIKVLDPRTMEVTTVAGSGTPGLRDGFGTEAQFSEPAGLAEGPNNTLIIADTNNCALRVMDLTTYKVTTLTLSGVPAPRINPSDALLANGGSGSGAAMAGTSAQALQPVPAGVKVVRAPQAVVLPVAEGGSGANGGSLALRIDLPADYHLTKGAPSTYYTQVLGGSTGLLSVSPATGQLPPDSDSPTIRLQYKRSPSGSTDSGTAAVTIRVFAKVYYCRQSDVCLFEQVCFEVPFVLPPAGSGGGDTAAAAGGREVQLRHAVVVPAPSADEGVLTF